MRFSFRISSRAEWRTRPTIALIGSNKIPCPSAHTESAHCSIRNHLEGENHSGTATWEIGAGRRSGTSALRPGISDALADEYLSAREIEGIPTSGGPLLGYSSGVRAVQLGPRWRPRDRI